MNEINEQIESMCEQIKESLSKLDHTLTIKLIMYIAQYIEKKLRNYYKIKHDKNSLVVQEKFRSGLDYSEEWTNEMQELDALEDTIKIVANIIMFANDKTDLIITPPDTAYCDPDAVVCINNEDDFDSFCFEGITFLLRFIDSINFQKDDIGITNYFLCEIIEDALLIFRKICLFDNPKEKDDQINALKDCVSLMAFVSSMGNYHLINLIDGLNRDFKRMIQ